ncbi:putative secondary metabolism biosynthetic enzyme [Neopestalotiopsis sp. 37M]|nr:putative secondary metabolism biosynthetic enzyme [Neopestalotiopsis sp. 37M]
MTAIVLKSDAAENEQRTLIPHMVDRLASISQNTIFGMWPVAPASYEAGYRSVTYAELRNIVDGLAWWLVKNLGPGQDSEALAYVGPNDVRIPALVLAAIKAGYALFLTSPRNSAAAHRALFDALECKTLITPEPIPQPALSIINTIEPRQLKVPTIDELCQRKSAPFVYSKTLEEGCRDPFWIIHTSGSTGIPKPLIWTQETALRHHDSSSCSAPTGILSLESLYLGKRVLVTVPPFHGAGLGQSFLYAIPFGNTVIAPAATGIVSAESLVEALRHAPADVALLVPSVVAELARNPALLSYCAENLELIVYIGGDLPQDVGDIVAAEIPLRCQWGASEVGMPQQLIAPDLNPRKDWRYVRFHPCAGAVFEEVAEGIFELVMRRQASLESTQTTFSIKGKSQLAEYRTGDLFAPHPAVPDAWLWKARADDIIVFLNGEKTNPVSMEHHITARNPDLVSGVIVIGTKRFQAALLIEPISAIQDTAQEAALIERIWPSIEEANRDAPAHARIEKSLVFATVSDRPLIRAGKGTLQRTASLAQYQVEIDDLYERQDVLQDDDESSAVMQGPGEDIDIAQRIRQLICTIAGWPGLDDSADIFELGLDSLQALQLTRALRKTFHRPDLGLSTVYQSHTVSNIAVAMRQTPNNNDLEIMQSLLATYSQLIQQIPVPKANNIPAEEPPLLNVVLSGSTGTLGTMILRALLGRKGIGHIYCLNRDMDGGRASQTKRFRMLDLDGILDNGVTFIRAELAHPKLGLDESTYGTLCKNAHYIVHNAWPVNFNLALSSFRPQIAGLVNLFSLAAAGPTPMRFLFVSSVGAVAGLRSGARMVPEAIIKSLDAAHHSGYARSKLVSELLCDAACRHLGMPVRIARVGQVAGPLGAGTWNRTEWFPSLVISSFHLSCIPEDLGHRFSTVDWIPADALADVMVDLVVSSLSSRIHPPKTKNSGAEVFNLRNPSTIMWNELLPTLHEMARDHFQKPLDAVPSSIWLKQLQESSECGVDDMVALAASNPAIKLLAFYRDGLWARELDAEPMSVDKSIRESSTLRDLPPIQGDWMRKWVKDWMA